MSSQIRIDSLRSEALDCFPPAANQPGASYVNGIERMGRAGRVVAEAAGPFRSQVYRFGSLETREAAEAILAAWIDAR